VLAIGLAIASSLVYGVSDFLGGLKSRSLPLLSVLLVSQGAALVVLALIAGVLTESPPDGRYLAYAALAGLAEAVGIAALYRGLAVGVMSIVAPVAATAPVIPVAVGMVLGETPGPIQGAGVGLAILGIVLTSGQRDSENGAKVGASVVFGLLAALGFGGFYVAMDAASEGGQIPWTLLMARITSVAVFAAAIVVTRSRVAVKGADVPVIALIGMLIIAGDAMYAVASTQGLLTVVAVLGELYTLVTLALARIYLNERLEQRQQQLGIATSLLGVLAVAAASTPQ
jgi:drug/metabolite transporter (DMT)-like permease